MEDKLFNFQYDWHLSTSAQKLMKTRRRKPDMLTSHTTWPQKKKFSLTPQSQVSCLHKIWSRIMMMILYNKLDMYSIRERGRERDRQMGYLFRSSLCMHNIINYFLLCVCRFIAVVVSIIFFLFTFQVVLPSKLEPLSHICTTLIQISLNFWRSTL